ncbi:hypothetical protein CONLIGDRAFT_465703 [Coniochaeta ligniaria NRRL 30616]|uniref:Uncharacterized protein n=1 Tax=Coniochaeta ligniaria NRRL 30616 TaxID=1408157 RepID=A0A1J7I420_9PEZI|nr:hypothetical protein CONLIGDRAFT_465703 [Coniochaeta ligniaria NRRL 30616]
MVVESTSPSSTCAVSSYPKHLSVRHRLGCRSRLESSLSTCIRSSTVPRLFSTLLSRRHSSRTDTCPHGPTSASSSTDTTDDEYDVTLPVCARSVLLCHWREGIYVRIANERWDITAVNYSTPSPAQHINTSTPFSAAAEEESDVLPLFNSHSFYNFYNYPSLIHYKQSLV